MGKEQREKNLKSKLNRKKKQHKWLPRIPEIKNGCHEDWKFFFSKNDKERKRLLIEKEL